MKKEGHFDIF